MITLFGNKIFKRQFLAFTLIIFIMFVMISILLFTTTKKSLEHQQIYMVENYRIQVSNSIRTWIDDKICNMKSQALYMGKMVEENPNQEELLDIINGQKKINDDYLNIIILDEKGNLLNSSDSSGELNLSYRDYFLNGINGKSTVTGIYSGAKTGTPLMAIGEPVFVRGKPMYVIAASISLEKLKQIVESQNFGDWGHAYLVDSEGMFITDSRFIEEYVNRNVNKDKYKLNTFAVNELMAKKNGTNIYKDFVGSYVFGSYEWIETLQAGLVVEFYESRIMQQVNEQVAVLSVLSVVVAIMGLILAFTMSRRFITPINAIIGSIERIIKRNYSESINIKTNTELDKLVAHFNHMQAVMKLREEQLRRKNEELKIQTAEAVEANKLKSQFLTNMSHELRTPLNSIIGFTTRVLKKSGDSLPDIQRENLCIVKQEAHHLLELIDNLLDYSKVETGKMNVNIEEFDLMEVIREVGSILKPIIYEKGLNYEEHLVDAQHININSDRIKVKQILLNLLSNASKYSEKGTIRLSVLFEGLFCKIIVEDEGIGISPDNLENIFDEFRQLDGTYTRRAGGTGLGLSITKKFIEMLGGGIEVKSQLAVGSCFTAYIPVDKKSGLDIIVANDAM